MIKEKWLTASEIAKIVNYSAWTIGTWKKQGLISKTEKIKTTRIRTVYLLSDVQEFIAKREAQNE